MIFLFIVLFSSLYGRMKPKPVELADDVVYVKFIVLIFFLISLLATVFFYVINGGLIYTRSSLTSDIAGLRLSYYASEDNYTGAGYFNQFKNILLPLTSVAISMYLKGRLRTLFIAVMVPTCIVLVTGTGQRFPLIFSSAVIFFAMVNIYGIQIKLKPVLAILTIVISFSVVTSLLGRASGENFGSRLSDLVERILLINQTANYNTFFYMVQRGFVNGSDWMQDILSIGPSHKPSTINRELFSVLYVSDRGNSPPSTVSSVYFNFGASGIILLALFQSLAVCHIQRLIDRSRSSPIKYLALIFLGFIVASWYSGGILTPFNRGALTLMIFLFLLRFRW